MDPMARKESGPERLGPILQKSLQRLDVDGRLRDYGVWPIWTEIVGSPIARHAQPERIHHGTLFVKVSSATWMQQLQFMKEMIAEKLNQRLGDEIVKNIFFIVGTIETPPTATEPAKPPVEDPRADVEQDKALAAIKDPQIRRAFAKLFAVQRKKVRKEAGK
jgi:hypothetical protein